MDSAIANFARFHGVHPSDVTEAQVRGSSAGVEGWRNAAAKMFVDEMRARGACAWAAYDGRAIDLSDPADIADLDDCVLAQLVEEALEAAPAYLEGDESLIAAAAPALIELPNHGSSGEASFEKSELSLPLTSSSRESDRDPGQDEQLKGHEYSGHNVETACGTSADDDAEVSAADGYQQGSQNDADSWPSEEKKNDKRDRLEGDFSSSEAHDTASFIIPANLPQHADSSEDGSWIIHSPIFSEGSWKFSRDGRTG